MEDAIKSIKAYLYDRESSPLTGAYIVSWCIWNYKFLLIIFSSDPINTKFLNIESYLFEPSHFFDYSQWFGPIWIYLMPLVLALLYLIALPKFSTVIYEITLKNRKNINKIKQDVENQELLSKEESIRIRREIYKVSEEYEKELKNKDEVITELKEKIAHMLSSDTSNSDENRTESEKLSSSIKEKSKELLKMASSTDGLIVTSELVTGFSIAIGKAQLKSKNSRETALFKAAIDELESENLIKSKNRDNTLFELTALGYEVADLIE